jgi:hypothetical protein
MTVDKILFDEFELLRKDLIKAYDEKGMRASGQWANELENVSGLNFGKLIGLPYTQQLEFGRDGGKASPLDVIKKWIEIKGIPFEGTLNQFAWKIIMKHKKQGWNREGFGGVDLISEVVTDERMNRIVQKIGLATTNEFVSDILQDFKKLQLA